MQYRFAELVVRSLGNNRIAGTAAVFYAPGNGGTEFNLFGNTYERIDPKAFDQCLQRSDLSCHLFNNHNHDFPLAGTDDKTLELSVSPSGLNYEATVANTAYGNETVQLIERGRIKGTSFGAKADKYKWTREGNKDIKTILSFSTIFDVSPTALPCYRATSTIKRSFIDDIKREQDEYFRMLESEQRAEHLKILGKRYK